MWGSTGEGKPLPTWPGETSPRAVQPHRGLAAARPPPWRTLPRGWVRVPAGGTSLAEGLPGFTPRVWSLRVGCRTPPLPPSSFPLFSICSAQTCKLLPCTRVSDLQACLFILQIFFFSFFLPWYGLSDRYQNECSGAGAWCGGAGHGACQPWGGAGKGSVSISVPG